jgi:hypothetical protein
MDVRSRQKSWDNLEDKSHPWLENENPNEMPLRNLTLAIVGAIQRYHDTES